MMILGDGVSGNTVRLRGMEFFAYHGVVPEERVLGQRFVVDVDLVLSREGVFDRDDLALTVDYGCVYAKIADVMTCRCRTIEYLAELIARELLTVFPCLRVRVEVHKPGAPIQGVLGDVSVEIVRANVWRAYLSLGSNLGDRGAFLRDALGLLGGLGAFKGISHVYETEPLGNEHCTLSTVRFSEGGVPEGSDAPGDAESRKDADVWFYNMVVELETSLPPTVLLEECQRIEGLCGRRNFRFESREPGFESPYALADGEPRTAGWAPRTLDIDILMLFRGPGQTEESIQTAGLMVPHPRLEQREFVLAPLREMVPDLVLPSGREVCHVVGKGCVRCLTEPVFSMEEFI